MNAFIIILISFFTIVILIQIFDIEIESLPECWVIRYSNPLTRIRYESIIPKKQTKPKIRIKELNFQGEDFILNYENCTDGYSEYPNVYACNLYLPKTVNKGKV